MSGTLHVVATPIGNLEDITLRALRVLREVAVIAAEDTRRTRKLLQYHGLPTPTISFHAHNTRVRVPDLVGRLARGDSVALVSDAGTPVLSDPGLELIRACIEADIPIDPVPGANAHLTALVASGFPAEPVTLFGFAPSKAKDRNLWFSALARLETTVVFFETPHRIHAALRDAGTYLGDRPLVVGRELTKLHQQWLRGTAQELVNSHIEARGEFTIVVGPKRQTTASERLELDITSVAEEFRHLTEHGGLSRRQAISELSKRHNRPAREIYATLESAKSAVP